MLISDRKTVGGLFRSSVKGVLIRLGTSSWLAGISFIACCWRSFSQTPDQYCRKT